MQLEQLRLFQENVMNTKVCSKCKEVKPYGEFQKSKNTKDGFQYQCKDCRKQYWEENKDKIDQYLKKYQEENKDKIKRKRKQYWEENKDKINQYNNQYYEENKEKVNQQNKVYYKKNKEGIKRRIALNRKERFKTEPVFRLRCNISRLVLVTLKRKRYTKKTKTYKILGIEYKDFYNWLYTKASNGLNYDKDDVHIDHVIPVSFADTEDEVLALNHYSNLQLLTKDDNLAKGNRYINKTNLDRVFQHHPNIELLKNILSKNDYLLS